jgi:hypothetical protein
MAGTWLEAVIAKNRTIVSVRPQADRQRDGSIHESRPSKTQYLSDWPIDDETSWQPLFSLPMRALPGAAASDNRPLLRILFLWFGEMPIGPGTARLLQLTGRTTDNDGRHRIPSGNALHS